MSDEQLGSSLAALLRTLKPKTKEPVSTKVLNTWIAEAEGKLGDDARGGRLGWLIASSVAIAVRRCSCPCPRRSRPRRSAGRRR